MTTTMKYQSNCTDPLINSDLAVIIAVCGVLQVAPQLDEQLATVRPLLTVLRPATLLTDVLHHISNTYHFNIRLHLVVMYALPI